MGSRDFQNMHAEMQGLQEKFTSNLPRRDVFGTISCAIVYPCLLYPFFYSWIEEYKLFDLYFIKPPCYPKEPADICHEEGLWFHVDGAFDAWAAITPNSKHLVSGLDRADSLAFDLHKWMYLSYPIGCVLIRNSEDHRHAFSLTPTYLAHGEGDRALTGIDCRFPPDTTLIRESLPAIYTRLSERIYSHLLIVSPSVFK